MKLRRRTIRNVSGQLEYSPLLTSGKANGILFCRVRLFHFEYQIDLQTIARAHAFAYIRTVMSYRLNHIAITTSDLRASRAFWETVFEARAIERPTKGVSPQGAWYRLSDIELHLQFREKPKTRTDQHFALEVDNADTLADRCRSMGRLVEEKELLPGFARRYLLYDPDDNRVEILQRD